MLDFDVRVDEGVAEGNMSVRFTPDLDVDILVFRLWPNETRLRQAEANLTAGPVTVDGTESLSFVPDSDSTSLAVTLGAPVPAGTTVEVSMPWRVVATGPTNDRVSLDDGAMRLGSFVPLLAWEPGVGWATDPPGSPLAEGASTPTADFDVTVRTPEGTSALASGVRDGPDHWTATAVRDFGLSVGRFEFASSTVDAGENRSPVTVTVGVHEGLGEDPSRYLSRAEDVLSEMADRFGYYPWPAFNLAITPNLGGGIEYPGHVMQGPGTAGAILSHEIGHQWFYGLVGNNQGRNPWLDEGLATFAENRVEGTLDYLLNTHIPREARGRVGEAMPFWLDNPRLFVPGVYTQGAQAVAQLGPPEAVDCALRLYVARNAHRIARPADFFDAVDDVFPDAAQRLEPFGLRP